MTGAKTSLKLLGVQRVKCEYFLVSFLLYDCKSLGFGQNKTFEDIILGLGNTDEQLID